MLLAGDEFGHTQRGNNNAYCQDNEISWIDWNIGARGRAQIDFVRRLTILRQAVPILRLNRFLTAEYNPELDAKDVRWITSAAMDIEPAQWNDPHARCLGMLLDGRAQGNKRPFMDMTALLILNAYYRAVSFQMPKVTGGRIWRWVIDTAIPDLNPMQRSSQSGDHYAEEGRSAVLCVLLPESGLPVGHRRARLALHQLMDLPELPTQVLRLGSLLP
jgi:glycogen operon protein